MRKLRADEQAGNPASKREPEGKRVKCKLEIYMRGVTRRLLRIDMNLRKIYFEITFYASQLPHKCP